jgi:Immunoglobulin-like domain of bacterial spore germination
MRGHRVSVGVLTVGMLLAACGDDESSDTTSAPSSTTAPTTTAASTTSSAVAPTTTTAAPTTTVPVEAPQLAVWPAPGVVFTTPEAAAADFLLNVYGFAPVLGEFRAGDSRSGEIEVFASEDGTTPVGQVRSTLFMRQLAPDDGWFVLAAASSLATIDSPASGATVPAASVDVSGVATGFEATIVVNAYVTGQPTPLDNQVTMAGNFGDPQPYTVSLDLSGAAPGDTVVLMVRGGVGLETDTGDFSAIPVLIAGS